MPDPKKPTGRPSITVDAEKVELMAAMGCTVEEIAAELRISKRTLMRRQKDPKFLESIERGKARGRATLRRLQWKSANAGNVTAQIWLGKQLLGQRDQFALDHNVKAVIDVTVNDLTRSLLQSPKALAAAEALFRTMEAEPGGDGEASQPR